MSEFKPTPNKMICNKAKECLVKNCSGRKPHEKDVYCKNDCDDIKAPHDSKCIPIPLSGVELIADERQRQIEVEGWIAEHDDDSHDNGGLALAGTIYAIDVIKRIGDKYIIYPPLKNGISELLFSGWPWDKKFWKPTPDDPIRQLVKAGALIAAEIDRLQRMKDNKSVR